MILVDTNAWIGHFRKADAQLIQFLTQQRVRTCDVVIGELLLGSGLPSGFAQSLLALPRLPSPTAVETRTFIERRRRVFAGSGVGWADVQVLLAAAKTGARVYSNDRTVRKLCRLLDVAVA